MNIQIISIFPNLIDEFSKTGIISRAIKSGQVSIQATQLRNYCINSQGQLDDTPYGGGSGMVLRPEPVEAAIKEAKAAHPKARTILMSPRGKKLTQEKARALANSGDDLIILCNRYEGVDQRAIDLFIDEEISIGDFILMGGETAALTLVESVVRIIPGVLGNPESLVLESYESPYLEHPQYTKPRVFMEKEVPSQLYSGNHVEIEQWKSDTRLKDTLERRPDLLAASKEVTSPVFVALMHHPVMGKQKEIIVSSITNIDLHDISRSCRTYGVQNFYAAHPIKTMRKLSEKILEHWDTGFGATYNPNRKDALSIAKIVRDFDDIILDIEKQTGQLPEVVATSARPMEGALTFVQARALMRSITKPVLILLGTGWGMAPELIERCTIRIEPIYGRGEFNHLSVRAAAAIVLDKLLGRSMV
mgnify:CR=1 FL=1